ncbi:MAG: TraB/GumN family protein [Verrucomicrobiota bacterium]
MLRLLLTLLASTASVSLAKESPAAKDAPSTDANAHAKTSLWTLSDEDSTVYLAGSVHLLRQQDMPLPEGFDVAYQDSDELVFEIDMNILSNPATALKLRELGSLPEGETLDQHFQPETMAALRAYLAKGNLPGSLLDVFTPGMVYLTLGSMEATRQGARPELGVETQFYVRATQDGKPVSGLETPEFQMSRFNEFDLATIESLVLKTLEEAGDPCDTLDQLIRAWKAGDTEVMQTLVVDEMAEEPELARVLLDERNANWIAPIEKAFAGDKNVMFIVGAAHLVGENSVIDLLRKKGYEVTQR